MRTQAREGESVVAKQSPTQSPTQSIKQPAKPPAKKPSPARQPEGRQKAARRMAPALPHERDQAPASQQSAPRKVIKQAYADLERGLEDTDLRGSGGVRTRGPGTPTRTAVKK